jgi:putative transposase
MYKKTFRYRLYPTASQERALLSTLDECRWLYNQLLEERRDTYSESGKGVSMYSQINRFPELKSSRESLKSVHSQVLQNVAVRVDLAFKAFFRRCKVGEKPGYPRFRGKGRYDSFTYPQSGFYIEKVGKLSGGGKVFLSKIGHVKAAIHRPLEGTVKTCTLRRSSSGKWFVCFACEIVPEELPESRESVGVDVGLGSFAVTSEGEKVENPRFFRKEEQALARAQRRLCEAENGTKERADRHKTVAKVHERIANKRRNVAHQASRKLVDRYGLIAVEALSVNRMNKNHCLAKSIMDAAWSEFAQKLSYKAEWAGREFVRVNPAYTSQDCSRCGFRQVMPLSAREYECPNCGLVLDRDHNAAINILTLGLQSQELQEAPRSPRFVGE